MPLQPNSVTLPRGVWTLAIKMSQDFWIFFIAMLRNLWSTSKAGKHRKLFKKELLKWSALVYAFLVKQNANTDANCTQKYINTDDFTCEWTNFLFQVWKGRSFIVEMPSWNTWHCENTVLWLQPRVVSSIGLQGCSSNKVHFAEDGHPCACFLAVLG